MKAIKSLFTICLLSFYLGGSAQINENEKFFFKQASYEFAGFKVYVKRNVATKDYLRTNIVFTNTSDKFMLVNAEDLFVRITGLDNNFANDNKKKHLILAPGETKGLTIKFLMADFRKEALELNLKKIRFTDKPEATYEFPDISIYNVDSVVQVGPVSWSVKKVVFDNPDGNIRIDGILKYTGTKFLMMSYDQIVLKKNGISYNCNNEPGKSIGWVKYKPYYDSFKKRENKIVIFPVKATEFKGDTSAKISFTGVFKEYSLTEVGEFRLQLIKGTEKDFKEATAEVDNADED